MGEVLGRAGKGEEPTHLHMLSAYLVYLATQKTDALAFLQHS